MTQYRQKKILVIEDDELLGEVLVAKLLREKYSVLWRRDGKSAIDAAREYGPDLILLDIVLPIVSGYEILEELHHDHILSQVPIIIVSNSKQPVEIAHSLELGVKDFLVKANLSPDEVITRVKEVFAEGGDAVAAQAEKKLSLVVIEDDTFLKELLSINFGKRHDIRFASNGEEGLRMIAERKPEALLLDIALPGMDGFTVLERIREDRANDAMAVIMLTNFGQEADRERALKLGADNYLVKANVDIDDIIRKTSEVLNARAKKISSDPVSPSA